MRYALYFTPPKDDPLTLAASRWLGRDAFSAETFPLEPVGDFTTAERAALVADPERYGFHATLKAPFALAAGVSDDDLIDAVANFARAQAPFEIPNLVVGQLGPFFALVPAEIHPPLQDFAAETVRAFEPFRAPLSEADIARRNPDALGERHRANLLRWGYPHVMDEFRFHMTLTGPVAGPRQAAIRTILEDRFAAFTGRPLAISGLALFVEETRGAPFAVHSWLPLGAA